LSIPAGSSPKSFCGIDLGHFVRWRLHFEGIPFVPLLGSLVPEANPGIVLCIGNKGLVLLRETIINGYLKNVANNLLAGFGSRASSSRPCPDLENWDRGLD
jgi:hypothetical protein